MAKSAGAQYHEFLAWVEAGTACEQLAAYEAPGGLVAELWGEMYDGAQKIAEENFETITAEQVGALYALIDQIYYRGRLLTICPAQGPECDAMATDDRIRHGGTQFVTECVRDSSAGSCRYSPPHHFLRIRVAVAKFLAIPPSTPRVSNGIECFTRLACLISVLQHESIHAVMNFECLHQKMMGNRSSDLFSEEYAPYAKHGEIFLKIGKTLFGFTTHTHCLGRPIAPSMLAVGQMIEFVWDTPAGESEYVWHTGKILKKLDTIYALVELQGGPDHGKQQTVKYGFMRPVDSAYAIPSTPNPFAANFCDLTFL